MFVQQYRVQVVLDHVKKTSHTLYGKQICFQDMVGANTHTNTHMTGCTGEERGCC